MMVRRFTKEDYESVATWWEKHGWPIIPLEALPPTGFIVPNHAAAFLYRLEGPIALMEWVVGNPERNYHDRAVALEDVIAAVEDAAKAAGYKSIFTMTRHERLINRLRDTGYVVTDEKMTHLMKGLT